MYSYYYELKNVKHTQDQEIEEMEEMKSIASSEYEMTMMGEESRPRMATL